MLGVEEPRVGLLSNGEEPPQGHAGRGRGARRSRARRGGTLNFVGQRRGHERRAGAADVVVTDGFTGNVALKLMEGVSQAL